jgi:hypothetical protein
VIVSDDNSANITPRFVTSLPASAIAGRGRIAEQLREGAGPRRVADRGDDALISSEASKAGQSVAIMSARSPVMGQARRRPLRAAGDQKCSGAPAEPLAGSAQTTWFRGAGGT